MPVEALCPPEKRYASYAFRKACEGVIALLHQKGGVTLMMMGIALQSFHAPQMLRIRAPGVELAVARGLAHQCIVPRGGPPYHNSVPL